MRNMLRRRPSPAMIVALVALSVALAGTAVAGVATISALDKHETKKVKKLARKQANKRITKRAPHLSVKNADTAGVANAAFSTFHNDVIAFPGSLGTIGPLNIPTVGSYVINAKLWAGNLSATPSAGDRCSLSAGGDVDTQGFDTTGAAVGDQVPVPLQLVHTFTAPGSVVLSCTDGDDGDVQAFDTKITAVQVAKVTNTPF